MTRLARKIASSDALCKKRSWGTQLGVFISQRTLGSKPVAPAT